MCAGVQRAGNAGGEACRAGSGQAAGRGGVVQPATLRVCYSVHLGFQFSKIRCHQWVAEKHQVPAAPEQLLTCARGGRRWDGHTEIKSWEAQSCMKNPARPGLWLVHGGPAASPAPQTDDRTHCEAAPARPPAPAALPPQEESDTCATPLALGLRLGAA